MKRMIAAILMTCLLAVSLSACAGDDDAKTADLVVFGTIYTAEDENDGLAEAFAVNELLTVREGLKALTLNGAWQLGLEK